MPLSHEVNVDDRCTLSYLYRLSRVTRVEAGTRSRYD